MEKSITRFFIIVSTALLLTQCKKDGTAIVEPRYGTYRFTTYTVDTFRFRVMLNNELVTDSLNSPQGSFSKQVNYFDSTAQLKISDAKTSQVILDSVIKMKIGTTTISLVQFMSGERTFIPPPPNEPPPVNGNYKIRFQYVTPTSSAVPYFDSVKFLLRIQDAAAPGGYSKLDSTILSKGELTKFYDTASLLKYRVTLLNPLTNAQITSPTQSIIGLGSTPLDFNTAIIRGTGITGSSQGPYTYEIRKVY